MRYGIYTCVRNALLMCSQQLAGYLVTAMAFRTNTLLLNFLIVEDWILYALRIHKPDPSDDLDLADYEWHNFGDMEQQRDSSRPALVRHSTA